VRNDGFERLGRPEKVEVLKTDAIAVFGASGLVGSAVVEELKNKGFTTVFTPRRYQYDLTDEQAVEEFFRRNEPRHVINCAAMVGGIKANKDYPAEFFLDNTRIGLNIASKAFKYKVRKLVNLGSTCIYPRDCPQPIKEEYLLTSPLEETNEAYSISKISILKLCEFFNRQYEKEYFSVMPTNIYGSNDNFDLDLAHAFPAIFRKIVTAKREKISHVDIWGTGKPIREFVHVYDVASAIVHLLEEYDGSQGIVNIGTGEGISILDLAVKISEIVGYDGNLVLDDEKPDGTPKKICCIDKLRSLGYEPKIFLDEGIRVVFEDLEKSDFQWKERKMTQKGMVTDGEA